MPAGTGTNLTFNFPLDLTMDPITYTNASVVQLFYRANWYHDVMYGYGFTEAAGNFQTTNFNRGGLGNDNVLMLAQAGADVGYTDNAFFSTPPDGYNGLCAMFVWSFPRPNRDGALDSEIVIHELTHGLSNRLLGGGAGISSSSLVAWVKVGRISIPSPCSAKLPMTPVRPMRRVATSPTCCMV